MIIAENKSLQNLNTFGINVSSKYFASVSNTEEIKELLSLEKFKREKKLILGGGSNILFTKDFDGLVISNDIMGISVVEETDEEVIISAKSGEEWDNLVNYTVNKNLGGIENLKLIPGKVGASPIQNIGAYGVELKDSFYQLVTVNLNTLEELTFNKIDCNFGYRSSVFKHEFKDEFIITEVKLKLRKNPSLNIEYESLKKEIENRKFSSLSVKNVAEVVKFVRESKLPDPKITGNAGSFFKNPTISESTLNEIKKLEIHVPSFFISENEYKIPAGWLIEKSGLKGIKFGNAGTYEKQALVLVNLGNANGKEIKDLAEYIMKIVNEKFGIQLTPEVNII